jgi:hypothetical protein
MAIKGAGQMGRTYEKICFLAFLTLVLGFLPFVSVAQASGSSTTAKLQDFKLPKYNEKTGRLEFIVYGREAEATGIVVPIKEALVDVVKKEIVNVGDIKDLSKVKLYDIPTPTEEVVKFWLDKPHCNLLIFAPQAEYDKSNLVIKGDKEIFVRSYLIDLNGVGFVADQKSETIVIKSKVKVVYRGELYEKMQEKKKAKEKKEADSEGKEKKQEKKETEASKNTKKKEI